MSQSVLSAGKGLLRRLAVARNAAPRTTLQKSSRSTRSVFATQQQPRSLFYWTRVRRTPIEEVPEPRQDDVNANAHHQAIVKFASDQKLNEAAAEFDTMRKAGILPTEATYKTMLNVYDQLGDAADLIATFEEMAIRGYKHDQVTRNVVLDMHIKRADIPSAEATFLDMRATPEGPDQYAFQRMLAMYVLGRKKSRAEMFVKEMQEKGFRPDTSLLDQLAQLK